MHTLNSRELDVSNPRSAAARTSFQNPCSPLGGWPDSVIWHHQCAEGDGASAVWERASEAFAAMPPRQ